MSLPSLETIWLLALAAGVLIAIPGPNHLYIAMLGVLALMTAPARQSAS